jgi:hypothetical protein
MDIRSENNRGIEVHQERLGQAVIQPINLNYQIKNFGKL